MRHLLEGDAGGTDVRAAMGAGWVGSAQRDESDARLRSDIVIGPADDGGYYLIGLTRPQDAMFAGITWGAGDVLAVTKAKAESAGLRVTTIAPWYDVDSPDDLRRVSAGTEARAARTRRLIRM